MAEIKIQALFANRIGGDKFSKKEKKFCPEGMMAEFCQAEGRTCLDFSGNEPDAMADFDVLNSLFFEAGQWNNRGHSRNGLKEWKEAAAAYLSAQFQVVGVNPEQEVTSALGTKAALSQLAQVFMQEGDILLTTTPSPVALNTMAEWMGATVYELPITKENKWLPDLESIPAEICKKAKLLYLNYPNNPTGAVATKAFFKRVVKFAKDHQVAVVHDASYAALSFDVEPLSFLSVPGSKQVGVEVHSLTQAFNMAGWGLAFVAGNAKIVKAFEKVKNANDSGQFKAMQKAGITALSRLDITDRTKEKYSRRLYELTEVWRAAGFKVEKPKAGYFLYLPAPKGLKSGIRFRTAEEAAEYLAGEKGILVQPFNQAGAYLRVSASFAALDSEEWGVYEELRNRLRDIEFVFK